MSMILVTHDLGVVAGHTDEIAVMYGGRIVEKAPTTTLFADMKMPYTEALMASIPKLDDPPHSVLRTIPGRPPDLVNPPTWLPLRAALPVRPRALHRGGAAADRQPTTPSTPYACWYPVGSPEHASAAPSSTPPPTHARRHVPGRVLMAGTGKAHLRADGDVLLRVEDLVVEVPGRTDRARGQRGVGHQPRRAARRDARPRRRVGLRQVDHRAGDHAAPRPTGGSVSFEGRELTTLPTKVMREARTRMQMIFQDPISSLNPRRKVRDIVMEPLTIWKRGDSRHAVRRSSTGRSRRSGSTRRAPPRARPTSSPAGSASASRSPARSSSTRA